MKNIFYNAEKFGLERLGFILYKATENEYDVTAVWRDVITRELFYGDNHGLITDEFFANYGVDSLTKFDTQRELYVHLVVRADRDSVLPFSKLTEDIAELLEMVFP